jgi:hypothetical protein
LIKNETLRKETTRDSDKTKELSEEYNDSNESMRSMYCCKEHVSVSYRCEGCHEFFIKRKNYKPTECKLCTKCTKQLSFLIIDADEEKAVSDIQKLYADHLYYDENLYASLFLHFYINNNLRNVLRFQSTKLKSFITVTMKRIKDFRENINKNQNLKKWESHYTYIQNAFHDLIYGKKRENNLSFKYNKKAKKLTKKILICNDARNVELDEGEKFMENYMNEYS